MISIIVVTAIAFVLSLLLVFVSEKYEDKIDLENEYESLLPGYNCGACGFNTCLGMSEKMLEDPMNYKKCVPLRGDKLKEMEAFLRKNKIID